MSLAGAGLAEEEDRFCGREIGALGQCADPGGGDGRGLGELELLQRLQHREVCLPDPALHEAVRPLLDLGAEQRLKIGEVIRLRRDGLRRESGALAPDRGQVELLAVLADDREAKFRRGAHGRPSPAAQSCP